MVETFDFDPVLNHKFFIDILGVGKIGASKISGLDSENTIVEYREGHEPLRPKKFAGMSRVSNLIVERGITMFKSEILSWREDVVKNNDAGEGKRTVIVSVGDCKNKTVRRYTLEHCWPQKVVFGDLNSNTPEVYIEELHIAFEDYKIEVKGQKKEED